MTKDQIDAKLAEQARKGDRSAGVLLALRKGDHATVDAHRTAIKTYKATFHGKTVRVTIPED